MMGYILEEQMVKIWMRTTVISKRLNARPKRFSGEFGIVRKMDT